MCYDLWCELSLRSDVFQNFSTILISFFISMFFPSLFFPLWNSRKTSVRLCHSILCLSVCLSLFMLSVSLSFWTAFGVTYIDVSSVSSVHFPAVSDRLLHLFITFLFQSICFYNWKLYFPLIRVIFILFFLTYIFNLFSKYIFIIH